MTQPVKHLHTRECSDARRGVARRTVTSAIVALFALAAATVIGWSVISFARGVNADAPSRTIFDVSAAATLKPVLPELIAAFEAGERTLTVRAAYGSSGAIAAQVRAGAPIDLFLSADEAFARGLTTASDSAPAPGDASTLAKFAASRLCVVIEKHAGDPASLGNDGAPANQLITLAAQIAPLTQLLVARIAVPQPNLAPTGRAAMEVLGVFGQADALSKKLVFPDSAEGAASMFATGAVQAAFLPASLAYSPPVFDKAFVRDIDPALHAPLEMWLVVPSRAAQPAAALRFAAFLGSSAADGIFRRHHLEPIAR